MNCQTKHQVAESQQAEVQQNGNSCCNAPASGTVAKTEQQPSRTFVPAVDTFEQGDELLLVADVPGAKADAIDIRYEEGELKIHAPIGARNQGRNFLHQEYDVGHYARAFRIGKMFDPSRIEAAYADGVLTLRLPKFEAVKPRKIAVKANV
jgi:HSP20 family protein